MKKIVYSILGLAAIAVMVSCNKELESENNPRQDENLVKYSFGAQIATKTVLNGETPEFVEGDQLKICYITDSEETPVSTVKGTIKDGRIFFEAPAGIEEFYAVYPDSDTYSVKYDKTQGQFGVKLRQGYAKGTFADANGMVAYSTVGNAFFAFKNLTAIVKIQAPSFDVKGVRFRGVTATNIDGSNAKFTGVVPVIVEGGAVSGFGNVTEEGEANMKTSSAVQAETDGYYYIPVNPVKINGLGIWFKTEPGRPGTLNDKEYTFERGHIYTINKIESKLYPTDWYVSPGGSGNFSGEDAANAISYATMREHLGKMAEKMAYCYGYIGTTFHLAAGEYTGETLQISTSDSLNFTIEGAGADQTKIKHGTNLGTAITVVNYRNLSFDGVTGVHALKVTKGICNLDNCNFIGCTTTSGNGAALVMNVTAQVTAKNCVFQENKATNGAAVCLITGTASSDDVVIFSAENCVFGGKDKTEEEAAKFNKFNEATTGAGGAVLLEGNAKGGQMRFNNCRFGSNKAKTNGAAVYCNNSTDNSGTIVLFNGCTFHKNTCSNPADPSGYSVFAHIGSRMAFNNCTWNVANLVTTGKHGSDIVLKGRAIVANSTIWGSGPTGDRTLAHIGTQRDKTFATIVNSVLHLKNNTGANPTSYKALFLASGYFLKMSGSIYGDLNDNGSAKAGTHYIFTNCVNRGVETTALAGAAGNDKEEAKDGVMQYRYAYTFDKTTYPDFTPMTLSDVKSAVKGTAGIGEIFDAWLTEIGAYDKDIMGNARNADAMSPGSYSLTWAE